MDKIIVLLIFSCDGEPTVPQVHYYHDNSTICARFCYSSGERFRSSCPVPIIIVVLPCGSSRAERLCDRPTFVFDTELLTGLDERFEVRPLAPLVQVANLTRDFPPKRVDQAAGFSAHLQCRRSRRVRGYRL